MPLTAEQEKAGTRQLRQWLENDQRLVTFRDLSRAVACHVDLAKNLLLSFSSTDTSLHKTYLLTGPLLSSAAIARTQLTAERLKAQEDEKSLAKLSATQKIRVVELDEVSDGERNSEDGEVGDDGMDIDSDNILNNDRGATDGISGLGDKHAQSEADTLVQPEQTSRWGVVMAGEEQLEVKKALFEADKLSIHIYALAPAPVRDPAQYLTHIPDLRAHKDYRNPNVYGTFSGDLPIAGSSSKGMKDGAMSFGSTSRAAPAKKEEKPAKKEAEPVKAGKGQNTSGKAIKEEASPAPAPSKAASTIGKGTASSSAGPSQRKSSARSKRQIQSDDGDEAEMVKTDTAEPEDDTRTGATSSMIRAEDDQAAMEAMMGMDMDVDMDMSDEDSRPTKKSLSAKAGKGQGVRKKRKVTRTVTETNAKGYTVTKTITEEVSCSEGEADEEPAAQGKAGRKSATAATTDSRASSVTDTEDRKPSIGGSAASMKGSSSSIGAGAKGKALPKPAAKPANGKPKGQSTLAGFFTKK